VKGLERAVVLVAAALTVSACGLLDPQPSEIPISGLRAELITPSLATVREEAPGGLLEPTWLPAGFELFQLEYAEDGDAIASVDLAYVGGTDYVHIVQSFTGAALEPPADGEPVEIDGVEWRVGTLERPQADALMFATTWDDGRSITVDGTLSREQMVAVIESLLVRDP
jgi:hypothetical protein